MSIPPNKIKYSNVDDGISISVDNFSIGTSASSDYGPTSTTNYWNGITPSNSGYTIYIRKNAQGPSIYTPNNDSELVSITNIIAGSNVANNATDALY